MEKLVRNAALEHMISNYFLSDSQHGFVYGRSCTTQLLKVRPISHCREYSRRTFVASSHSEYSERVLVHIGTSI